MPRPDKATFIQEMLSEHQLRQQKPEPDSQGWWREVAQGLGVKLFTANEENRRLREALEAGNRQIATLRAWMAEYQNDKYTGTWWLAEFDRILRNAVVDEKEVR